MIHPLVEEYQPEVEDITPPDSPPPKLYRRDEEQHRPNTKHSYEPTVIQNAEPIMTQQQSVIHRAPPSDPPRDPPRDLVSLMPVIDAVRRRMRQIDQEINATTDVLAQLRLHQEGLQLKNMSPDVEIIKEVKRTFAEKIFAENRAKAKANAKTLQHLSLEGSQPEEYFPEEKTRRQHQLFKRPLIDSLKKKLQIEEDEYKKRDETYSQLSAKWRAKVEKTESSRKSRDWDLRFRTEFESTFPEVKKHREEAERISRIEARTGASDAHLNQSKMRQAAAVIPRLQLRPEPHPFHNRNGYVEDMKKMADEINSVEWNPDECETFRACMSSDHKNFAAAAEELPAKTVEDCVKHYYQTKHREKYKDSAKPKCRRKFLRKSKRR